jgi:cytochrome b6-f complex iron-sulfur subunit
MSLDFSPSRRSLLGVSAAACSACVLAACAPSTGGSGQSATGDSGQSGAEGPAPVASGGTPVQVMKLADVAVGDSASGEANGNKVLVYRPDEKTVEAFSAICTHQGCTVAPAGAEFHCPCHGSVYSARDGRVLDGPAPKPLPRFAAAIDGDWITVTV